jgi:dihydroorotate dehydrogenase electron transfer subunit
MRYNQRMCQTHSSPRGVFAGQVCSNDKLCAEHYRLVLLVAGFPPSQAGQFVQLQCRQPGEPAGWIEADWPEGNVPQFTQPELTDREPLLRRPLSLADHRDDTLEIIYRVAGSGTGFLARLEAGETISVLGPLGNPFPRPDTSRAVLVGGGVGIPPMLYLARALQSAGVEAMAFCGVRCEGLLPLTVDRSAASCQAEPTDCCEEFAARGAKTVIASDDGTVGTTGLVTDALLHWLGRTGPDDLTVYTCGPEPMMRATAELCGQMNIPCHASLERNMACGMGTCQSCIVKIRDDSPAGWSYKLCCTHGPVFPAGDILWD